MTFEDPVEVEPRLVLGETFQAAVECPGHFPDDSEAGVAGVASAFRPLLDLPEHVPRLQSLGQRFLEEHESALSPHRVDIDSLGCERPEDALSAVVDDTDAKLATLEAGANVRDGDPHFVFAPVVQRAGMVGRAELLDGGADYFQAMLGVHGIPTPGLGHYRPEPETRPRRHRPRHAKIPV